MEKRYLTTAEATDLLIEGERVHTFRNPNGMLIGCDWDRDKIINLFNKNEGKVELGGEMCKNMGHAIIVFDGGSPLFIENDKDKLAEFDKE